MNIYIHSFAPVSCFCKKNPLINRNGCFTIWINRKRKCKLKTRKTHVYFAIPSSLSRQEPVEALSKQSP